MALEHNVALEWYRITFSIVSAIEIKRSAVQCFLPASSSEIVEFPNILKQVQSDIVPTNCTKAASLTSLTQLKNFMDHCCHIRHYMFSIKKCGASDCTICKPHRLPKEIFDTSNHLPDPVRDGDVYTQKIL